MFYRKTVRVGLWDKVIARWYVELLLVAVEQARRYQFQNL